ncbi:MAG: hypothetical protein M3R24_40605 [Chloroflexota bacterium]|nr:hypothetical protein [Chloroflexota bacterium]
MQTIVTPTMPALNITRQHVGQALRQMRLDCQYNGAELNAVNRAALNLEACTWQYDGEALVIESATTMFKRYHVQHNGCDCKAGTAGRPCWHLAAFRLMQRAAEIALQPAKPKKTWDQIQAEADELFS